jgi:hypothetical protein
MHNRMTYDKPEIVALGNAIGVIESTLVKPYPNLVDGPPPGHNPAYDLDE